MGKTVSRRAGFSLVELFVVTAILAALAALLLPVLNRAREKTRRMICVANLRQIGQAALMYEDENGALPTDWYTGYVLWDGLEYVLYGRLVPRSARGLAKAFYCPSATLFAPADPDTGIQNLGVPGKLTASTYYTRGRVAGGPTVLSATSQALAADLNDPGAHNHAAGVNALYTDGAVRFSLVPANWNIAQSNAWAQLDQGMVAAGP